MADKPIPFSGPMVRALDEGRKTQTRRVLVPQPSPFFTNMTKLDHLLICRDSWGQRQDVKIPYAVGDRLWVREAWRTWAKFDDKKPSEIIPNVVLTYTADGTFNMPWQPFKQSGRKRPGMFMPRWASRFTLTVTDVRVQRVQEISDGDCKEEGMRWFRDEIHKGGVVGGYYNGLNPTAFNDASQAFQSLWDSLNKKRGFGWDVNPWVAVYTFAVEKRNIDQC